MFKLNRLMSAGVAVAAVLLLTPATAADTQTLAGTWVIWAELPVAPGVQVRIPALHTYHSEGTITSSDTLMFGGLPGVMTRNTPLHGIWQRVGNSEFATTNLSLSYDAASNLLIGFVRARATVTLSKDDPYRGTGTARIEFLACSSPVACPDPLADDAAWMPMPGIPPVLQVTGARLRAID